MQPYVVHKAPANQRVTIFTLAIPGWKSSKNLISPEESLLCRYLLIFECLYFTIYDKTALNATLSFFVVNSNSLPCVLIGLGGGALNGLEVKLY